jgi:hypothetical protein
METEKKMMRQRRGKLHLMSTGITTRRKQASTTRGKQNRTCYLNAATERKKRKTIMTAARVEEQGGRDR